MTKMNWKMLLGIALLSMTTFTFTACSNDDDDDDKKSKTVENPASNTTDDVVTGEAVDVSFASATLYGYINNDVDKYSEFGIVYGTENDAARLGRSGVKVKADGFDAGTNNRRFSVSLTGLKAGATYYYYAYAGQKTANKLLSFTTPVELGGCPNAKHPHWIDLGLPSGTKWRCCNEGASSPEAYGEYYTFRQVSTAPTLEQIKELVNKCNYTWTTLNGVNGGKFTGPNGGTIFLPAAGCCSYGEFYAVGSYGYCWTSTPGDSFLGGACYLHLYDESASWNDSGDPYSGYPVRPVRKN